MSVKDTTHDLSIELENLPTYKPFDPFERSRNFLRSVSGQSIRKIRKIERKVEIVGVTWDGRKLKYIRTEALEQY